MMMEGLRLVMSGDEAGGVARYEHALAESPRHTIGVGLHLRMLEEAGHRECAAQLRRRALVHGADTSVRTLLPDSLPEDQADEYLSLFQAGHINAWMIARYLLLLDRLQRTAELQHLLDARRLVRQGRITADDPSGRQGSLTEAIRTAVLERESLADHQQSIQSVHEMFNLKAVHTIPDPAFEALVGLVRAEVSRLIADWVVDDHPVSRWVPRRFDIRMWALTSRGQGFNTRHVHHQGWYTGVFYVTDADPEWGDGGNLHLGRPAEVAPETDGWVDLAIRPEAGLLVLMPSYFTHWTVPLGQPGLRISLAFDVIDARDTAEAEPERVLRAGN